MIKKAIFGILLLTTASGLVSQNLSYNSSDSLNHWVESQLVAAPDTPKVYKIAHLSLYLSNKEKNETGLMNAFQNLGKYHELYGQIDSAIYYYNLLKDIYKNGRMTEAVAETCMELKDLYNSKAAYSESLKQVFEALEIFEEKKDQIGIALCYTHICDLLYYENNYQASVDYCEKAIAIQKEIDAKSDLAVSYRYKAASLLFIEGELENALATMNKAIEIYNELGETGIPLLASLNGRGNILKYMERYDEAIADYQFIYEKTTSIGLDRHIIPSLGNIGHVYVLQEKYTEALPYILEAIDLIKESGNTNNLWENYMHASDIYEGLGDYKNANTYNKLYSKEYANYLNTIIDRLESETQIKYETAKKDEMIVLQEDRILYQKRTQILYISIAVLLILSLLGMLRSRKKISKKQKEIEKSKEELQHSLENLKATQAQLIHAEKMASLGELTAGIAHEIQNPLNFVNNFSEVSSELVDEMNEELEKGTIEEAKEIASDIKQNLEKILHHGKRADDIVKGMLQHSRSSSGVKEPTDINALADEYLRLAYHGLRAKDKSFNAMMKTNYDETIGNININPQDIGRVILNLITNAFYACTERSRSTVNKNNLSTSSAEQKYKPTVSIITKRINNIVQLSVIDNGNGIPRTVQDKIFQPFFTTKPTGQGTGLGLSLSYDIIKAHGGELKMETKHIEGLPPEAAGQAGTEFIILLPI